MKFLLNRIFFIGLIVIAFISCESTRSYQGVKVRLLSSEFLYDTALFPQCHASTIVDTDKGLLTSFLGGTHERHPDVCIYISRIVNGNWAKPQKVADGVVNDTLVYPIWNPVLFNEGERLYLYYKVGLSPTLWWGMSMFSVDDGDIWSKLEKLPDEILDPVRNKPMRLNSGMILSPSSTEYTQELWESHIERSTDNGQSWNRIDIEYEASIKVIQPILLTYLDNKIQVLLI